MFTPVMRQALRRAAALPLDLSSRSGLLAYLRRSRRDRTPILAYHGVSDEPPAHGRHRYVGCTRFRAQMDYLSRHGNVLTLGEYLDLVLAGRPAPANSMVITFDDGLGHLMETAVPVLEEQGLSATFFIVTDSVEKQEPIWTDKAAAIISGCPGRAITISFGGEEVIFPLADSGARAQSLTRVVAIGKRSNRATRDDLVDALEVAAFQAVDREALYGDPRIRPFTWEDVERLASLGHEIASHSLTHAIVSRCEPDEMRDELRSSRRDIETRMGRECRAFAYPNGSPSDFSDETGRVLAECGYIGAVTTVFGLAGPRETLLSLPRVGISRKDTMAVFKAKLAGLWWNG